MSDDEDDDIKLESPLVNKNEKDSSQNLKTFIYLLFLNIAVIAVVTFIIINLLREDTKSKSPKSFQVLLKDKDFI